MSVRTGRMIRDLKPYPKMKDPGVSWLGAIPNHWDARRQRTVARLLVSNVDKHTHENEIPVRLCNYVDVYKNDRITSRVNFMLASASPEEVERFRLEPGDVVITKDSEAWDDIGVPALVEYTAPDLVCGYHLAMLRPRDGVVLGGFLFRALQCKAVAAQFFVMANGVTRYGLSHDAIKRIVLPLPPLSEQASIARFLQYADRRITRYVASKQRQIGLLREQTKAIVEQAVTQGLDATVAQRDSGVEWLGQVPAHWEIKRAKWYYREVDERSATGAEERLSVSHLTGVTPRSQKKVTMFQAESYAGHKLCKPGDLVINTMWAWMGALGVANQGGIVSPAYAVYRPETPAAFHPQFADHLLTTRTYVAEYVRRSTGIRSSRLRLYPPQFLGTPLLCPPLEEQAEILRATGESTSELERASRNAQREIELLGEYWDRLLSDVVSGKLDVREAARNLPDDVNEFETTGGLPDLDIEEFPDDELGDIEEEEAEA